MARARPVPRDAPDHAPPSRAAGAAVLPTLPGTGPNNRRTTVGTYYSAHSHSFAPPLAEAGAEWAVSVPASVVADACLRSLPPPVSNESRLVGGEFRQLVDSVMCSVATAAAPLPAGAGARAVPLELVPVPVAPAPSSPASSSFSHYNHVLQADTRSQLSATCLAVVGALFSSDPDASLAALRLAGVCFVHGGRRVAEALEEAGLEDALVRLFITHFHAYHNHSHCYLTCFFSSFFLNRWSFYEQMRASESTSEDVSQNATELLTLLRAADDLSSGGDSGDEHDMGLFDG